jgi:hypothetical protein
MGPEPKKDERKPNGAAGNKERVPATKGELPNVLRDRDVGSERGAENDNARDVGGRSKENLKRI